MNDQKFSKYKTLFIVLAALIALLEIPGALDIRNQPYGGYWTGPKNTVNRIFPNSPAEQAGFQMGDQIISSGGIDVKDTKAWARRPRARIGEMRTFVVARAGQNVSLDLTFSSMPAKDVILSFAGAIMGFCFLIFGLRAYLKVQNKSTTLLALVGLCFGLAFINTPYLASYTQSTIFVSIAFTFVVFGFAFLLHFMMVFPKEKTFLTKKNAMLWLYGPAALVALLVPFLIIFQPEASGTIFTIIVGLFVAVYLGLAVVVMVHSYVKATPHERTANGLNFMLLGTVIGVTPMIISAIISVIAPKVVLPGVEFYDLAMVLIPFAFAQAVLKKEKALTPALA